MCLEPFPHGAPYNCQNEPRKIETTLIQYTPLSLMRSHALAADFLIDQSPEEAVWSDHDQRLDGLALKPPLD